MTSIVYGCGNMLLEALSIVMLIFFILTNKGSISTTDPLEAVKEQARTACSSGWSEGLASTTPYRIGKVLIYTEREVIEYLSADRALTSIMAVTPEEVGTVICVGSRKEAYLGKPPSRLPAYQLLRDICIINLATGDVIYKTTLKGSIPPPSTDPQGVSYFGTDPAFSELCEFIARLPVKQ